MSKVYIVFDCCDECDQDYRNVIAVFSTKQRAIDFIDRTHLLEPKYAGLRHSLEIDDWEVNEH